MKARNISMLLTTICFLSTQAMAAVGNESGNGGGGIVCLQPNGSRTVTLLDLAEASQNSQLTVVRSNAPWQQQLENALEKYSAVNSDYVLLMRQELEYMKNNTIMVKGAQRLPPPSDTQISNLDQPRNCFLEGVANYDDAQGKLFIDQELEQLLPETDKAALRFHEAWYRVQRQKMSPTGNSKEVREVTARVFAQQPLEITPVTLDAEKAISQCESEDNKYQFYVVPQDDGFELQFVRVNGISMGEKTSMFVPRSGSIPRQIHVEGDVNQALSEGLALIQRPSTKEDRDLAPANSGTDVFSQKQIYGLVKSKNGPSMKILLSSSDWISNESIEEVEKFSRDGFESRHVWNWKLKRPTTYENFSNYIVLQKANDKVFNQNYYSNDMNSRFKCARTQ